jgi:hypothetical protein
MSTPAADKPEPFAYPDDQWDRISAIVESAGGLAARDKLDDIRLNFTRDMGGWKSRLAQWGKGSHSPLSPADAVAYKRVGRASRELLAAFDAMELADNDRIPFPAILSGHTSVWKDPAETTLIGPDLVRLGFGEANENRARFAKFLDSIEHVAKRAEFVVKKLEPKDAFLARDTLLKALCAVWCDDLGLGEQMSSSATSRLVKFIPEASTGICEPPLTPNTISSFLRKWPRSVKLKRKRF